MTMIPSLHTVPDTAPMTVPAAPPKPGLPLEIATRRALAWSESLRDEAALNLPDDIVAVLEAGLPAAIAKAREDLEPVEPEEVVIALQTWADRRNLPLPEGLSLDLDVETMSSWPRVVFREAFRRAWERFSYPRVPTAAELHRYVAEDVKEARGRLASLDTAARKLETIRMRRRWDEEARSRHAAIKAKERTRERAREQVEQRQPAAIDLLSVGETPSPADYPVGKVPCSAEAASTKTSRDTGNLLDQPTPAQDLEQTVAVVSPTNSGFRIKYGTGADRTGPVSVDRHRQSRQSDRLDMRTGRVVQHRAAARRLHLRPASIKSALICEPSADPRTWYRVPGGSSLQ